ncbi:MAG: helix-turn-helix transcriptional regulator [Verrucomicrobiota bacterium]
MKLEPLSVTISSELRARFVYAYEGAVDPGALAMRQSHPPLTAWLVRRGRVRVARAQARALTADPGQWLLLPPRSREHTMEPGTRLLSVRFELEQAGGTAWLRPGRELRLDAAKCPELEAAGRALIDATERLWLPSPRRDQFLTVRPAGPPGRHLRHLLTWSAAFQAWTTQFLEAVLSRGWKVNQPDEATGALPLAQEHLRCRGFAPGPPRLAVIARAAGVSVSHLKRLFAEELGTPPLRWWDQLRLEEARRRLYDGADPVKRIAYELGFHSPAHFSAWFRRRASITPLRYRQRGGTANV